MAITFNRRPVQVNTPDSSDIKNYYFNHYNWKGINDDKNILAVDQETFQDSSNIYVDSEGLLKSRPSMKILVITVNGGVLSNIVDVWAFDNVKVYKSENDGNYYLTFVDSDNVNQITLDSKDVKLINADKKIFVFSKTSFNYYDIDKKTYSSADSFIHVPVTSVIVNGIKDSETEVESPNVLTSSYYTQYIYDNSDSLDFTNFVGDDVTVEIDGIEYSVNFVYNNELVFVGKYTGLTDLNYSDEYTYGENGAGIPLVETSEQQSMLISSYEYTIDETSKKPTINWSIFHTVDGVVFNRLPSTDGIISTPKLSRDGFYAIVFKKDGPYIINVVNTSETIKYPTWTNLLNSIDSVTYSNMIDNGFNMNEVNDVGEKFNQSINVNGYFRDDTTFAFTYGSNLKYETGDPIYMNCNVVKCFEGKIENETVFDFPNMSYTADPVEPYITNNPVTISDTYGATTSGVTWTYEDNDNSNIFDLKVYGNDYTNTIDMEFERDDSTRMFQFTLKNLKVKVINTRFNSVLIDPVYTIGNVTTNSFDPYSAGVGQCTILDGLIVITIKYIDNSWKISWSSYSLKIRGSFLEEIFYSMSSKTQNAYCGLNSYFVAVNASTNTESNTILCVNGDSYEKSFPIEPIRSSCIISNDKYLFATYAITTGSSLLRIVVSIYRKECDDWIDNVIYEYNLPEDVSNLRCVFTDPQCYLLTNNYLFNYLDYSDTNMEYEPIPYLFEAIPLVSYYAGNDFDSIYLVANNSVYSSKANLKVSIKKLTEGKVNYLLPENTSLLDNYYFSVDNILYISARTGSDFKWYFPEINTQTFDSNITNLHPISNSELAIFFDKEIWYVKLDENSMYRYYKSKIQVGCMNGCDVITTYDGKYTIFTSDRGLVALSYQNFIASEEQSLTYLSDTIYSVYQDFIKSKESKSIKLFKHGFWLIIYKLNSKKSFVFDFRNNSWWPIESFDVVNKIVSLDDKVTVLCNKQLYTLDTSDSEYYDFDGVESYKIVWNIVSQKLHFGSPNNHKHIINMTFMSVHDNSNIIDSFDFKLQVNNYRKNVNGNIGTDDYTNVTYKIDSVRTFVQRVNYSKVNEFQYLLSYDDESSINIPLSLNAICVKYKVGGQVR